jgi:hypothetical protein
MFFAAIVARTATSRSNEPGALGTTLSSRKNNIPDG